MKLLKGAQHYPGLGLIQQDLCGFIIHTKLLKYQKMLSSNRNDRFGKEYLKTRFKFKKKKSLKQ